MSSGATKRWIASAVVAAAARVATAPVTGSQRSNVLPSEAARSWSSIRRLMSIVASLRENCCVSFSRHLRVEAGAVLVLASVFVVERGDCRIDADLDQVRHPGLGHPGRARVKLACLRHARRDS